MSRDKQIEEMAQYYVLRNKDTGMYFRGKGVNRWGKYFNQATIYRVRGTAEASVREVSWHGEKAEIVPIQIFENNAGYRKSSEVAEEIFGEIEATSSYSVDECNGRKIYSTKIYTISALKLAELKKKYTESEKDIDNT